VNLIQVFQFRKKGKKMRKFLKKYFIFICLLIIFSCSEIPEDIDPQSVPFNSTVNENDWILVPKGEFISGLNEHEEEVPYDYEIMVTEVTYSQYSEYLNSAENDDLIQIEDGFVKGFYDGDEFRRMRHEIEIKEGNYIYYDLNGVKCRMKYENGIFSVKDGYERFPIAYVSWFGANAYAEYYGYDLASLKEWEKAARGSDKRTYPWGFEEPTPDIANYHHSKDPFDHENAATPVGFYNGLKHGDFQTRNNKSPYGCYDMAGNVAEWLGTLQHGSHLRLIYGGSFMEYGYNLRSFTENSAVPEYCSFQVGFRCTRKVTKSKTDKVNHELSRISTKNLE